MTLGGGPSTVKTMSLLPYLTEIDMDLPGISKNVINKNVDCAWVNEIPINKTALKSNINIIYHH